MSDIFSDAKVNELGYLAPVKCYFNVPEVNRRVLSNGCGPQSVKLDFVPDILLDVDLGIACEIHDLMYHFGKDDCDKRTADNFLLFNIINAVNYYCSSNSICDRFKRVALREAAFIYYKSVAYWGTKAFYSNKT